MPRILSTCILLCAFLLALREHAQAVPPSGAASGKSAGSINIGVIIDQTGPLAVVGKAIVNAITLASEQKDPGHRVHFIFEDDGLQPARAVSAAQKLLNEDHVSALITFAGGSSAALAPLAENNQVPLLTIAAADQHTIGKQFVYREFLSTTEQVKLIHAQIEHRGLKRVAIVTTTQESLVRLRDLMKESLGPILVADEEVLPTDAEMQSLASRVGAKRPDCIVLYLLPPQLGTFARAVREQGFKGEFFGGIQVYNLRQVVASGGALVGTIFPGPALNEHGRAFADSYKKRFGESLVSEQEIYGYDLASLLIAANATNKGELQRHLQSLHTLTGLAGEYPRKDHNFFEVPAALKRIASETTVERLE